MRPKSWNWRGSRKANNGVQRSWDSGRHQRLWAGYMTVANQPLLSSELNLSQISRRKKKGKHRANMRHCGVNAFPILLSFAQPYSKLQWKPSNPSWVSVRRLSGVTDGISSPKQSFLLNQPVVFIVHSSVLSWHDSLDRHVTTDFCSWSCRMDVYLLYMSVPSLDALRMLRHQDIFLSGNK